MAYVIGMNQQTSDTIESLERQLLATQAEVDALRDSLAQLFQLIGSLEVKIAKWTQSNHHLP